MGEDVEGHGPLGFLRGDSQLVFVEGSLSHPFFEGYEATAKFIIVNIIASILFMQELVLPVALGSAQERAVLYDATLRITELRSIAFQNSRHGQVQKFNDVEAMDMANALGWLIRCGVVRLGPRGSEANMRIDYS